MAFQLSMETTRLPARRRVSTVRFTRGRDDRRRHNPNVDAAWWPRSSSLAVELPHVLKLAQESGFRATSISYRLDEACTAPPSRIAIGSRRVKVSGYHNHHRDMITLVDGISHERLQVVVVPADTAPLIARRALRMAAAYTGPIQGAELLDLARGELRTAHGAGPRVVRSFP